MKRNRHFALQRCDLSFKLGIVEHGRAITILNDETHLCRSELGIDGDDDDSARHCTKINCEKLRRVSKDDANGPKVFHVRSEPLGGSQAYFIELLVCVSAVGLRKDQKLAGRSLASFGLEQLMKISVGKINLAVRLLVGK